MELSVADATFSSLTIKMACTGHSQVVSSQAMAHATGNLTLDLTWFTATIGTTTLAYTPSSPPTTPPFSSGAGTFNAVSMIALAGAANQLSLQGANITAVGC
jgi:hypothetical protein